MWDGKRYKLIPYPNSSMYTALTPMMIDLLSKRSDYLVLALELAKVAASEIRWSVFVVDIIRKEATHIVTCLGEVEVIRRHVVKQRHGKESSTSFPQAPERY